MFVSNTITTKYYISAGNASQKSIENPVSSDQQEITNIFYQLVCQCFYH